jgi:hypothetical protein
MLAGIARQLDHTVGRNFARLQVLIDVRTPMNLSVLRPVWSTLVNDPRLTVAFAAEHSDSVRAALGSEGLGGALISRAEATWRRWDLVLTADAWNHTPLRRSRRRMQFFHGVAGKYDLDAPDRMREAGLDRFDRIAFINEERMQRYVHADLVSPARAVLVGYPKADDLVNGRWSRESVRQSLALDTWRPTVVYAPTFSIANSLHLAGIEIIQALLDANLNVIVKLHDRSMIPDAHHTAGIDWPARLSIFERNRRFVLAREGDAEPVLAAADVLVTDHSTVGFEFALLDRPIVIYDAPALLHVARIDAGKWELLRSMATVVHTPHDAAVAVHEALEDPSRLAIARQRAHSLFANPGTATARALMVVYELLGVAMPATVTRSADTQGLVTRARYWQIGPTMQPRFSVIIATYNRAGELRRTLDSLGALKTDGGWELIVVDNNSNDDTAGRHSGLRATCGRSSPLRSRDGPRPKRGPERGNSRGVRRHHRHDRRRREGGG